MIVYRSRLFFSSAVLFAVLQGCDNGDAAADDKKEDSKESSGGQDSYPVIEDNDGDGIPSADGDCDDNDPLVAPGQVETCDGVDNNCNGAADEGLPNSDGDQIADCLDSEDCDGLDNDGDGDIDEDFSDGDDDGVADCLGSEVCDGLDNDADGQVDEGYDVDGDGYTQCGDDGRNADCADDDPAVYPTGAEVAGNRADDDCDGLIDEGTWAAGDLVITEIMTNPADVADPEGEWFEVYNASNRQVYLNGLVIESAPGESHIVEADKLLLLSPGEFFVFGLNSSLSQNGEVDVGYAYGDVSLSNESDELSIAAGSVLLDIVTWDDGATMPDATGASMGLDSGSYDAANNDDASFWCVARIPWSGGDAGSPGTDNEYCATADHDGDGYNYDQGDCDDGDASIYPGAYESDPTVDNDCDGDVEWGPVAVPTSSSTGYTCDAITLDGSGSYDPDASGTVGYLWELTSAPAGSAKTSADIVGSTAASATFQADVDGTYVFSLTVNDGGADSVPASVTVVTAPRPSNAAPTANAGPDASTTQTGTCASYSYGAYYTCDACATQSFTLDGAGSTDPNGDELAYTWVVTAGSTYGAVSATAGSTATVDITGVPATYGSTTAELVTVELTVTDCMGATSVDTVSLTYNCTGA